MTHQKQCHPETTYVRGKWRIEYLSTGLLKAGDLNTEVCWLRDCTWA